MLKEAQYYQKKSETDVICGLCPHNCEIPDGKSGICKVRTNRKGILYSDNYCKVSAIHLDPVEKKPLYHFYPGKNILSVGSIGCNLKCKFCQNSSISQISVSEFDNAKIIRPELIVSEAEKHRNNIGVAYTYNEPAVWYEFMYEIAVKIKKKN
jgi:pyruvate formate lyase activating enzyme